LGISTKDALRQTNAIAKGNLALARRVSENGKNINLIFRETTGQNRPNYGDNGLGGKIAIFERH
jgi:hypothetical protein